MSLTRLELFKKHVRADDFDEDDEYLQYLLDTAEDVIVKYTRRTRRELADLGECSPLPLPLMQAVLMLAGHWYNQREAVASVQMHEVPDTLRTLVNPYRKF